LLENCKGIAGITRGLMAEREEKLRKKFENKEFEKYI